MKKNLLNTVKLKRTIIHKHCIIVGNLVCIYVYNPNYELIACINVGNRMDKFFLENSLQEWGNGASPFEYNNSNCTGKIHY